MLLSLMQADRTEVPLAALHVMQFMGLIEKCSRKVLDQLKRMYRNPYTGAHLIVHSLKNEPYCIEHNLKAGIYTLVGDSIKWIRKGTTYRDVKNPDEFCILGNLPQNSTEIRQHARLAMIQTSESILESNLQQLESHAANFVSVLQNRCRMLPFNGGSQ
jgi:hypothetical protein